MPVCEDGGVAVRRAQLGDDPVGARADVGRILPIRAAVAPERPAGALLADLLRRAPLVSAVIPLAQIVARERGPAEPGEPARLRRPHERAREDEREVPPGEGAAERGGLLATPLREREVGRARVPALPAPLGLPVPDEDDLLRGRGHGRGQHAAARERRPPSD